MLHLLHCARGQTGREACELLPLHAEIGREPSHTAEAVSCGRERRQQQQWGGGRGNNAGRPLGWRVQRETCGAGCGARWGTRSGRAGGRLDKRAVLSRQRTNRPTTQLLRRLPTQTRYCGPRPHLRAPPANTNTTARRDRRPTRAPWTTSTHTHHTHTHAQACSVSSVHAPSVSVRHFLLLSLRCDWPPEEGVVVLLHPAMAMEVEQVCCSLLCSFLLPLSACLTVSICFSASLSVSYLRSLFFFPVLAHLSHVSDS